MRVIDALRIEAHKLRDQASQQAGTGAVYAAGEASRAAAGLGELINRLEAVPEWQARQATEDHAYWLGLEDPQTPAARWEATACLRALCWRQRQD
ncbi:hypothetical protein GCM10008955_08610 [Deinococcus malanensis]|uniref:Uncharacterized protein n=1 Tax=Deinococcus malanensis TaxID=1706855 RepID=A0ABQ2EMP0_9DEIO|nr:hypothetical protein [Deinococcus malanensis]GGK17376.1 hypothetical protein GCM10008955_08610 [Deinococcus malanensis]